ncbi:MAG: SET domain-containing protein [Dehalococcoidales bacterium]|nr:SET domain-containing protein [Dehalococcoidales bacterium]
MEGLEVRNSGRKGRGVFASRDFGEGELIETCHVILCPEQDTEHINRTFLYNYYFNWGPERNRVAVALGFGSLYNHSYHPNARYEKDLARNLVNFRCLKPITRGEEITVNYNENPSDKRPVWFLKRKSEKR